MDARPVRREGKALALSGAIGYVAVLSAWIFVVRFGRAEELSGAYATGFTVLVLPALLLIPVGLSVILGLLAIRCTTAPSEVLVLRLGGMFAIVFCVASGASLLAFYATATTVLYLQPHVLATTLFCFALAGGCGHILRRIDHLVPVAEHAPAPRANHRAAD